MAEQDLQQPEVPIDEFAGVGARLRRAREKLRLSRADIAARTKIAERHLAAIEEERFGDLASSTYAVGFSRAYARTVGLDEREIAHAVRVELDMVDDGAVPPKPTFEPGDPARVPSQRTAWLAGAAALAVIVGVAVFWGSYISPAVSLPDLIKDAPPQPATKTIALPPPAPAAANPQGQVVITAKEAGVWVRIADQSGKQLFQKEMALGESYALPLDAAAPQLRTAWPDALSVTIGGQLVAPLADKRKVITVPISAAALLARGQAAAPAPVAPTAIAPTTITPATITPATITPARVAPAASAPKASVPAAPAARPASTPLVAATPAPAAKPAAPKAVTPAPVASPSAAPAVAAPAAAAPAEAPKASTVSQ